MGLLPEDAAGLLTAAARAAARFGAAIPRAVQDEIAQEAALRTLAAARVREPLPFARRVARNLAVNWLRRRQYELPLVGEAPPTSDWARVDARLDLERAWRVLRRAPASHGAILRALYLDDDDVEAVVRRAVGADAGTARWVRARDATYKRHKRALSWTRRALGG